MVGVVATLTIGPSVGDSWSIEAPLPGGNPCYRGKEDPTSRSWQERFFKCSTPIALLVWCWKELPNNPVVPEHLGD